MSTDAKRCVCKQDEVVMLGTTALRRPLLGTMISIVLLLSAKGCIPVEDMGEYWDKGTIDPDLAGAWKSSDGAAISYGPIVSFEKSENHYEMRNITAMMGGEIGQVPSIRSRTLTVGTHKFLMFDVERYYKDIETAQREFAAKMSKEMGEDFDEATYQEMMSSERPDFKGVLQRYSIEKNVLSLYLPNYEALARAIEKGEVNGRLAKEDAMYPLTVAKLDRETLEFLARRSDDSKFWDRVERFERIENLEEELERLRELFEKEMMPGEEGFAARTPQGKVVDRSGNPISGADVQVHRVISFSMGTFYLPAEIEVIDDAVTDSNGGFEFDLKRDVYLGEATIAARKEGLAVGWTQWSAYDDSNSVITLAEPVAVRGEVANREGAVIAGAEVRGILVAADDPGKSTLYGMAPVDWLVTTTNEAGLFEFSNLPAGARIQLLVSADGYARLCTAGALSRGDHRSGFKIVDDMKSLSLVLRHEAVVEGVVVDKNGSAVGGVDLLIKGEATASRFDPDNSVAFTSESDGSFRVGGLGGGRYLVTSPERSYDEAGTWKAVPSRFFVRAGQRIAGQVEVSKGGVLEVVVVDVQANELMAVARVSVRPNTKYITSYHDKDLVLDKKKKRFRISTWHERLTDNDGRARFHLPTCEYVVEVSTDEYKRRSELVELREGETKVFRYEVGDEVKTVITVADAKGKPVVGTAPQVLRHDHYLPRTDAEGKSIIGELDKEFIRSQCVIVRDCERNLAGMIQVPDEFESLHIEVERGIIFRGRFVDEKGNPISDSAIHVESGWGIIRGTDGEFVTDSNGYFEIPAIPPLPEGFPNMGYIIATEPSGYSQFCKRDIRPKGDVDFGDLVLLTADKSVCGIVVDEDGKPIAGAEVSGSGYGQPIRIGKVTTDEKGQFRLEGVTGDKITIHAVRKPEYRMRHKKCRGGDQDIRIVLEGKIEGVIDVLVVDAETGEPVENVQVTLTPKGTNRRKWGRSDENGMAHFKCEWRGTYDVEINRKHYRVYPRWVSVPGSGTYKAEVEIGKREPIFVTVTAVDANGEPIPKAWIGHFFEKNGKWQRQEGLYADKSGQAVLRWTIESKRRPPQIRHLVIVTERGGDEIFAANDNLTASGNIAITVQMEPRVIPVGRVVDSNGNGIERMSVEINISGTDAALWGVKTDSEGRYTGRPVPTGFEYKACVGGKGWLSKSRKGYKRNCMRFEVGEGDEDYVTVDDIVLEELK